jgi:hypothetical protein
MSLRSWFREKMLGDEPHGDDVPPNSVLMSALLGRETERGRSLGEYDASNYPPELREQLERREEVMQELLRLEITSAKGRIAAIPKLKELLRKYPHPLAYETLINAYIDSGRFDEAKGIAFAAKQRRAECAISQYPEIRSETDSLREWSSADIDDYAQDKASSK